MKLSKIRKKQSENWKNTLSRIDEIKCPNLYKVVKEILNND